MAPARSRRQPTEVTTDRPDSQPATRVSIVGGGSVYPAVQNLLLACVAGGLGCAISTLHCRREDDVRALLDIPHGWATAAVVPIGDAVGGGHGPISRQPPERLAHRDRFGARRPGVSPRRS